MTNEILYQIGELYAVFGNEAAMRQYCESAKLTPTQEAEVMAGFLSATRQRVSLAPKGE